MSLGEVLDTIVHSAFAVRVAPIHEQSDEEWDRQVAVDLGAVHRSMRSLWGHLSASFERTHRAACILLISSVHADDRSARAPGLCCLQGRAISTRTAAISRVRHAPAGQLDPRRADPYPDLGRGRRQKPLRERAAAEDAGADGHPR
jgi:NAD(P)-dependent dehydrogenase (short-subunit alcohol dehydrogenase family)